MTRHIKRQHPEYYAEQTDLNSPKPLSETDKILQRRRDIAINQRKYYHETLKFKLKNRKEFLRYVKKALSSLLAEKASGYIQDLMVRHGILPEICIPVAAVAAAANADNSISRRYHEDMQANSEKGLGIIRKVEEDIKGLFHKVSDNELWTKIDSMKHSSE